MLFVLPMQTEIKVNVLNRVAAKLIDIAVVVIVVKLLPYPVGPLLGFLYSLFADGMPFRKMRGQSLGKKLMKLQVVHIHRNEPASLRDSAMRNAPVGVATFFAFIPVWGWLILILIGVPLMIMEVYLMLSVEAGHRLGDVMGDTRVVELKKSA
jgi:uncharacterized RDD family membrane protein YckC